MSDGQLWSKDLPLDELVHRFTVGEDTILDLQLVSWDLLGNAAHVSMLASQGLISEADRDGMLAGLATIRRQHEAGEFSISTSQEDCHTAIEQRLAELAPAAAGNVHLGRSRNDQVLTALRLYMKHSLLELAASVSGLAGQFAGLAAGNAGLPMPGYTHLRRAMPSTVGQWLAAIAWGLEEALQAAGAVHDRLDSCPLGSGAGFGVPLDLDREYCADLLGFARVQWNPVDCANSRGRHELALCNWVCDVGNVLEKFACDALLYSTEEFGFISLPDAFTTGSSIMPQKRNPDVLELARGKFAQLRAWRNELEQIHCALPSNYHRDYQLLKPALFNSVHTLSELLAVLSHILPGMQFNQDRLLQACSPELHATAEAYRRVSEDGLSFREAYRKVGAEVMAGEFTAAKHGELGSSGLLSDQELKALQAALSGQTGYWAGRLQEMDGRLSRLLPA